MSRIVRSCRFVAALVFVANVFAAGAAAAKEPESGSRSGTATPQCPSDPDEPICGTRISVRGTTVFTLTPSVPIDLDVFFYNKKNELTDQFTTTGCTVETGRTSDDAITAVIVIPRRLTCGKATSVGFTYAYRVVPRSPCPEEINQTCRPLWAKIALFGLLGLLLGPVIALLTINATRRARAKRAAVS